MMRVPNAMSSVSWGLMLFLGAVGLGGQTSAQEVVELSEQELLRIMEMSPLPDPPPDPTNRYADDPAAAHLGQFLFFDTRLSLDGSVSCATCHDPNQAFTDGKALSEGLGIANRNAPTILNVAYNRWFFWDGRADTLWAQALQPIENDVEMGSDRVTVARLCIEDGPLRLAYEKIFGSLPPLNEIAHWPSRAKPVLNDREHPLSRSWFDMSEGDRRIVNRIYANLGKAIAAYERRLISRNAPFDRFVEGLRNDDEAKMSVLSVSARRGMKLFVGRINCRLCHHGPNLTDNEFHYLGIPSHPSIGTLDRGRIDGIELLKQDPFNAAGEFSDQPLGYKAQIIDQLRSGPETFGQQKTASLRNVAMTAPYAHQGQFATIQDVLYFDSTLEGAVLIGHHQEQIVAPLNLTQQEMDDLEAFLVSLSDVSIDNSLMAAPPSPIFSTESPPRDELPGGSRK